MSCVFVSLCLCELSADFGEFRPGAKTRQEERGRDSGERPTLITADSVSFLPT